MYLEPLLPLFVFQSSYLSSRGGPYWWRSQVFTQLWVVVGPPKNLRWATFLSASHQTQCIRTYAVAFQSILSLTHRLAAHHVGDSSLSGSEDQSCWMHSSFAGNPINLQEELFHGAILSSHLNFYSQSLSLRADYLCRALPHFLFHLWPALSLSFSLLHTSSARLNPVLVISYLCWIDLLSLHLSGGFSETYAALCDYNGIGCKEEVQWVRKLKKLCKSAFVLFFNRLPSVVQMEKSGISFYVTFLSFALSRCCRLFPSLIILLFLVCSPSLFQDVDTIYHSQDNREFNLLDFSHLDSRWHS